MALNRNKRSVVIEVLRRRNPKLISCWKSNPNVNTGEGRYCSHPLLGEHTEEVLKSLPCYDKKIGRLWK